LFGSSRTIGPRRAPELIGPKAASAAAPFFGSKQKLFVSVMALPFDPEELMPQVLGSRS
jgi:hypothetical protein